MPSFSPYIPLCKSHHNQQYVHVHLMHMKNLPVLLENEEKKINDSIEHTCVFTKTTFWKILFPNTFIHSI